ncbi:hypothetical protein SGRA_4091 [Saprospira grandis str. Lewin]|uniref:Uncharacterized protein n=1 Tax=Saprospira grandis (strain Lewin) TaxID=984262 RepID=H6L7D4_SAPGL|nr:hypothetical protein SGRA_4091 [Saprospira grandis str. Lewin]
MIWGPRPAKLAAAMLRGSQVCSALQASLRFAFGLALWATPSQRWAVWPSAMAALPPAIHRLGTSPQANPMESALKGLKL